MNTNELTIFEPSSSGSPPLTEIARDWFCEEVDPSAFFSFSFEKEALVFRASRPAEALCHPLAREGLFQEHLWEYDVAEFFLSDPVTGNYLEFNLSPNGAHWACLFKSPRCPVGELRETGASSRGTCGPEGWQARADLPLLWLEEHLHFGPRTRMNVTFIVNSPAQKFLTAVNIGDGDPDFHRPSRYARWVRG